QQLPDLTLPPEDFVDPARAARSASRNARRFRFSNEERAHVRQLCADPVPAGRLSGGWDRIERRRFLAKWGPLYASALDMSYAWTQVPAAPFHALRREMDEAFVTEDVTV